MFQKMFRSRIFFFSVSLILLYVSQEGSTIKCWRCSSDASNAAFCGDPFNASIISDEQRRWAYIECIIPPGQLVPYQDTSDEKAFCKKMIQLVDGKEMVISRSCIWQNPNAPKDACMKRPTPHQIETTFCETCDTDGCNDY